MILFTSVEDSMDLHFWSPFQATQATYSTSGHGGNTGPAAFFATNEAPHPLLPFAPCRLEQIFGKFAFGWRKWGQGNQWIIYYILCYLCTFQSYTILVFGLCFCFLDNVANCHWLCSIRIFVVGVHIIFNCFTCHIMSWWWWSFH